MAGPIESKIIKKIIKRFAGKYDVDTSYGGNATSLPIGDTGKTHNPDVILKDKKTGEIRHIIEVETDPVRKSLVGSAIIADFCFSSRRQVAPPRMWFLIGSEKGVKQIKDFQARQIVIESYVKFIAKPVVIDTENNVLGQII